MKDYPFGDKKMVDALNTSWRDIWYMTYHVMRGYQRENGCLPKFSRHKVIRIAWRIVAQRKMVK